ncbi:MAG: ABC transporter permease [Candidatus Aminicenantes bacterium]|nr:MAG: ABC transporter permease [Candidatus Aminicenantes bacterium]
MSKPPKLAKFLLKILSSNEKDYAFLGDIQELFHDRAEYQGLWRSKRWYWWEIIKSIPKFFKESIRWRLTMFENYLKITLRNIKGHKGYSFINLAGLAVGIACTIFIILWVQDELSFDRFHGNAGSIYRVVFSTSDDGSPTNANGSFGVGPALKRDFPEVKEIVRIRKMGQGVKRYIGYKDKKYYETRFFFSEPTIFSVFDFPLDKGDPTVALDEPNSIVLTEEMAKKYFGNEDPMGKTIEADPYNDGEIMLFRITGIAKNVPSNSHFRFDFLASYRSMKEDTDEFSGFYQHFTYALLQGDKTSAESLNGKLMDFLHRNWRENPWYTISLQPLLDIRLHSRLKSEIEPTGNILYVYIFMAIAVFVLIIACINFMNLTSARAIKRAKEVGIRKVVGARKNQLVRQFLGESLLLSLFSASAAVLIVIIALPMFNKLTDKGITFVSLTNPSFFFNTVAIALVVGFIAGIYPAFFLSAFKPIHTLKSRMGYSFSGAALRKGLVIFQFALSIGIIFATLIVHKQMNYIRSRDLGYDREQIMVIPLSKDLRQIYEGFRNELLKDPGIENTTTSSLVPTRGSAHLSFRFEGNEELLSQAIYLVDKEFIQTYGLKLLAGKNIQLPASQDQNMEFLVSELTTQEAGYSSPQEAIGKSLDLEGDKGHIVGVVNDINIYSLHRQPYSISYMITSINNHNYLSVRILPQNISRTIEYIQETWKKMVPYYPLDYFFLDESFEQMHVADKKMSEIFTVFSILAIFVACMGLFGLAAFTADQKTKEIGVRKILGASASNIYVLLSREFLKWVTLANIIAWPVAYYAMHKWLQNFVFRVNIGGEIFILSGVVALVISMLTVSFQSIKAAVANPIDSLRYE